MHSRAVFAIALASAFPVQAQWRQLPPDDRRQTSPPRDVSQAIPIEPGASWPQDSKFRWLVGTLSIPATVEGRSTRGRSLGLAFNCGDGGEIYVGGRLRARYDNDHPALVLIAPSAEPGAEVRLDVQVYGKVQGGDRFGEARWVIIDESRARAPVRLCVHPDIAEGEVPAGLVGLSQGGGLSDYEDATAAKLREGGFRWFRMDNAFTPVVRDKDGALTYDWTDFDRRVDFIASAMGADPIIAVSYMPIPFDAVPNDARQSAPRDYGLWEDLCYRAAKRSIDRGKRIPFWEVWNEVNTGWLKPGPEDSGSEAFSRMYRQARGRDDVDAEAVRRFEAYSKLYRATARGVLRADPTAKIGGPALASGPWEHEECGHCFHGKGFAKGLMLFCRQEGLPLDFVSWHEYFHPADVFVREANAFRDYLREFPDLEQRVESFMITEWNQAWWSDRPQDHEIGAAWCADCLTRAFIPARIDRPCFFYVKQNDMEFRGDFSLLMRDNVPKAAFNVLKIFNHLSGRWIRVCGADEDISAVACWDAGRRRLAIVLVNFRYRYAMERPARLTIDRLPPEVTRGAWREWTVDALHSNVWHDPGKSELEMTGEGSIEGDSFTWSRTLLPNSVVLIELLAGDVAGRAGPHPPMSMGTRSTSTWLDRSRNRM
ncbi:MAG: hypothetical protein JXP34_04670 [Planctomycetes bacterium]|nr:hypothetical protein [Planctomycetota bacterium]